MIGTKRSGGVLVGVPMDVDADGWESEGDVEARMERGWKESEARGLKVRVVLSEEKIRSSTDEAECPLLSSSVRSKQ